MEELRIVKNSQFGSVSCDYYGNGNGEFFMTRHRDRIDKFSVLTKLGSTDGKQYDTHLYSAKGVYEICRWSRQPKADEFYDHVYEILEGLRLGYLKLSVEKSSPLWVERRERSKLTRREETNMIQKLVDYAKNQGSEHSEMLYLTYSKLANRMTGISDRDKATAQQLSELSLVENIILNQIRNGMEQGFHYKKIYRDCKDRIELFRRVAYLN